MAIVQTGHPELMGGGRGETGYWTPSVQAVRFDIARTMLPTDPTVSRMLQGQ
jgi:hypothetical protein